MNIAARDCTFRRGQAPAPLPAACWRASRRRAMTASMPKRDRSTKAAANSRVAEAMATLRARLQKAGATKVLDALDRSVVDTASAVSSLFLITTLGRGIEDDVAEALARMGHDDADVGLIIGLGSKRTVLRRAAARALCIAPSRSREVRAALQGTYVARDNELRVMRSIALALSSDQPAQALTEELERATTYEARSCIVRLLASGADSHLATALLARVGDPVWSDVRAALLDALGGESVDQS
jgi:hypothetical protein